MLFLSAPVLAAPSAAQVEQAAIRVAATLDGVLRDCPASYAKVGTPDKVCVGAPQTVEQVRSRLSSAHGADLQGVWRSRDAQRSVYNWLRTPGGYVYLRVQADPDGRAQSLIYLDAPPDTASAAKAEPAQVTVTRSEVGPVTIARPAPVKPAAPVKPVVPVKPAAPVKTPAPAAPKPAAPKPATQPTPAPQGAAVPSLAPVAFSRVLELQDPRMNGADVRAVQNRLIALTIGSAGGQGDGWYGPVTAATVRAFQAANGLPVTGRVDRATWALLFSAAARAFTAPPRS
ncbi:peptidoglycan-binding domain-containing protein [Deinococcus hohokamensis]|uniref:Peptidoglycan-binding protein n=1 Tax=Deinococcus hohokamensis TaxID=309883 RepID=A0ABV9IC35_9DEIO